MNTSQNHEKGTAGGPQNDELGAITEGFRNVLFLALAALSITYFAAILLRFAGFISVAEIPKTVMDNVYIAGLVVYMGAKQVSKACTNGRYKQRMGEHFVVAWMALTTALLFTATFRFGNPAVIEEIWPHPLAEVVGLFIGNETIKMRMQIVRSLADTIRELRTSITQFKGTP